MMYDQPKSSKYFEKDPVTGTHKCKICWATIESKDNTGLLRLHLQQVHKMNAAKIYDPFVEPKVQKFNLSQIPVPILPSVPKFAQRSRQIRPTLPNSNSLAPRHSDWLNPFFQLVSDPQQEEFQQDKDQVKYLLHCTQFTDPLKYQQYNRYMEEQITDIRQQLNQLPNLCKIPAMVTLNQRQQDNKNISGEDNQLNKLSKSQRNLKQFKQKIQEQISQLKKKFQIFQWKNQSKNKMASQGAAGQNSIAQVIQILSQNSDSRNKKIAQNAQQAQNKNVNWQANQWQLFSQLAKIKDFNVIRVRYLDKQNVTLHKQDSHNFKAAEKQSIAYVFTNSNMRELYQKYADSLFILELQLQKFYVMVLLVEDWRLNINTVGFLLIRNEFSYDMQLTEAALMLYFHTYNIYFPKSVTTFTSSLNSKIKQTIQNMLNLCNLKNNVEIQQHTVLSQQNLITQIEQTQKKQKLNTAYKRLITRLEAISNKYAKISKKLGRFQIQLKNPQYLLASKSNKSKQALQSFSYKGKTFKGFADNNKRQQWNIYYNKLFQKLKQHKNTTGLIIKIIMEQSQIYLQQQKKHQLQQIVSRNGSKYNILNFRNINKLVSSKLYRRLQEIQRLSQNILFLKHISPTYIQVYSAFPTQQNQQQPQNMLVTSSCKIYKNTVVYNQYTNYWMCNCNKIVELGIPCSHLLKIVNKMRGSLQYYINDRWKPSLQQCNQLSQQINKVTQPQSQHFSQQLQYIQAFEQQAKQYYPKNNQINVDKNKNMQQQKSKQIDIIEIDDNLGDDRINEVGNQN